MHVVLGHHVHPELGEVRRPVPRCCSTPPRAASASASLLQVDRRHGLHLLEGGLVIDTRDDEISPSHGGFHHIEVRASPWKTPALPYRYLGISGVARMYVPVIEDRLVAALRVVGDIQMGDVPFYELSRFDETSALGGSKYVRGVPSNRYYGKRKLLGNLEVRSQLYHRKIRGSRYELGFTAFLDSGRVWADLDRAPELDGTGHGLEIRCRRRSALAEGPDLRSARRPGLVARRPPPGRIFPRRTSVLRPATGGTFRECSKPNTS